MNVLTDKRTFERAAAESSSPVRVPLLARTSVGDPYDAYLACRHDAEGFFLETTGGQSGHGYFGVTPTAKFETNGEPDEGTTLAAVEAFVDDHPAVEDADVPYPVVSVGWISYDVARELEDIPEDTRDDRELPRAMIRKYETFVFWEEPRDEGETPITVVTSPVVSDDPDAAYSTARETALDLVGRVQNDSPTVPDAGVDGVSFRAESGKSAYEQRVRTAKEYIRAGDAFQIVVSHRLASEDCVPPARVYRHLRSVNPSPYLALLEFDDIHLVSANPQLLFDHQGDTLTTRPIAGTRPRGETESEDAALLRELKDSTKDLAEHDMLVDMARNDVGRVSNRGTVSLDQHATVERYSEVQQLVSEVTGETRPDVDLEEIIAALFPGAPLTGAPKPRAMELIEEIEQYRRGPYCGSIGVFGPGGNATLSTTIRTLVYYDDRCFLRVGGGIVDDSDPEDEYHETMHKARALLEAVEQSIEDDVHIRQQ